MSRRMTTEEFVQRADAVHGGFYDYFKTEYAGMKTPVTITCPVHGDFEQWPEVHLRGNGCPACAKEKRRATMIARYGAGQAMQSEHVKAKAAATKLARYGQAKSPGSGRKRMTTEEFVARARGVHGDRYDYSETVVDGSQEKVRIICPEHGAFLQTPAKHLKGRGCPHPDCIQAKREASTMAKYGVRNYMQSTAAKARAKPKVPKPRDEATAREKRERTMEERYGVPNPMQVEALKSKQRTTCLEEHGAESPLSSPSVRRKIEAAMEARHGGKGAMCDPAVRQKSVETCRARYGTDNPAQSEEVRGRIMATCEARYGGSNPMKCRDVVGKVAESKIANGTCNTSAPEDRLYGMLCDRFGMVDVVRQYWSPGYPFACDFYVRSRDMFIELNASWTHGGHWYGRPGDDDVLSDWEQKGTGYYDNAVHTWTDLDVRKRKAAAAAGLDYVVFWDGGLRDAELWFAMGCPDGRDWDAEYSWISDRDILGYPMPDVGDANYQVVSRIAKHYQFGAFYHRELALWEANPDVKGIPLRVFLYWNRWKYLGKLPDELSDAEIMRGFGISGLLRSYTVFDSRLMADVIQDHGIKSVYDPCAGWGERMLCCAFNGDIPYLGVDINKSLASGYAAMVRELGLAAQEFAYGDAASVNLWGRTYDAIITCPPYGNTEIYSDAGAENLRDDDFLLWWARVVHNSLAVSPRLFCFQVNQKWLHPMAKAVIDAGFELVDARDAEPRSSHMTRRNGVDCKKEHETMLVFRRI